jgi:hypothetical protein
MEAVVVHFAGPDFGFVVSPELNHLAAFDV